jgi:alpha-tubulin suppressor-like RCC1 family protein
VKCWGLNDRGQLGNGTTADAPMPTPVVGLGTQVSAVAAGYKHTCAVTAAGAVKCWGSNQFGQLGIGTTTDSATPVDVTGLGTTVVSIATGGFHTCAITSAGAVKCWGLNAEGQLGMGTATAMSTQPVNVIGLASGASAVSAGDFHTCALTSSGQVRCWGRNQEGQVGKGQTSTIEAAPVDVILPAVYSIAAGGWHTCAVTTTWQVKCWGRSDQGQVGQPPNPGASYPVPAPAPIDVVWPSSDLPHVVVAGEYYSCALTAASQAMCWGRTTLGGPATATPTMVAGLTGTVANLAAGAYHTCAVLETGDVWCWGQDEYGELGDNPINLFVPQDVTGLTTGVTAVGAGSDHTCAIVAGGLRCWGANAKGQLGDGTLVGRALPGDVVGLTSGVSAVTGGRSHTCALTTSAGVKCWGANDKGQLGDGTLTDRWVPGDVTGLTSGVQAVAAASGSHTCALTAGGGVKCWGANTFGQLGNGTTSNSSAPVDVSGLASGILALHVGSSHACALTNAGAVKCWGYNGDGELGTGTWVDSSVPVDVTGLTDPVAAIGGGLSHTCAISSAGGLKCWGFITPGPIPPDNTRNTPTDVTGLADGATAESGGWTHACVITRSGGVQCWGDGLLGDGNWSPERGPAYVVGLNTGVASIAAGYEQTCAVTTSGGLKCWGNNSSGQLGNGMLWGRYPYSFGSWHRSSPVAVAAIGFPEAQSTLPVFTLQPAAQTVLVTQASVTLTATAAGVPAPAYQWQMRSSGTAVWTSLATGISFRGTNTDTLTITNGAFRNGAQFRVVAVNTAGATASEAATLSGNAPTASPSSLRFAATKSGSSVVAATPAQTVTVDFDGGTAFWTATANVYWLRITSGTGTGPGQFSVSIIDAFYLENEPTTLSAEIAIRSSGDYFSTYIPVQVTVDYSGGVTTMPPFGLVDTPLQNANGLQGSIGVTGWALDDVGVASVKIYRNCLWFEDPHNCQSVGGHVVVYVGDAVFVSGARPDVEAVYPTYPESYRGGWGCLLLTSMLPHIPNGQMSGGQGTLTLYAFATDAEGHTTLLGRTVNDQTPTTVTLANDTIAKPFGAIDTPEQGQLVTGTFVNFGWVLTPDLDAYASAGDILIPTDGSTMHVFIDGVSVGTVAYNQCRGSVGNPVPAGVYCNDDVANVFGNPSPQPAFAPRVLNASVYRNLDDGRAAIGAYTIDTTLLANGMHTIAWGVTDSAGRVEGIGSRYFTVLNGAVADSPAAAAQAMSAAPAAIAPVARAEAPARDVSGPARVVRGGRLDARTAGGPARRVWLRDGFDMQAGYESLVPAQDGVRRVSVPQLGRVELWLGTVDDAYGIANGTARDLPVGSSLDARTGQFTWTPGPGHLGTYRLAFVRGDERILVDVTVR